MHFRRHMFVNLQALRYVLPSSSNVELSNRFALCNQLTTGSEHQRSPSVFSGVRVVQSLVSV